MNAPAQITTQDLWSPAERAHRGAISIHCPNEDDFSMGCRADIAAMRDRASAGMRGCCEDAYPILAEVARIAALTVYAPLPPKQLVLKRAALAQAIDTARALERAENAGRLRANGGG
jgi:hypothetical protein